MTFTHRLAARPEGGLQPAWHRSGMPHIEIRYLRVGEEIPVRVTLAPESYFEPDSVPIHNHAVDYLDEPPSRIRRTELLVTDPSTGDRRLVVETFWDEGRSRIIEVQDSRRDHWEIIYDVASGDSGVERDIIRYGRIGNRRAPFFHTRYDAEGREQVIFSLRADPALERMLADELWGWST